MADTRLELDVAAVELGSEFGRPAKIGPGSENAEAA